ncbi:olfactory receptor 5V1-like [Rhinatrema bivittatum]|uniref:olfactory receptor 5V1-like n=1 Tax=Rhinatrema bivittatum TaxID=194408 RepID=UPI00112E9C51|nr:olfactory receptor 5V1-like [Rhinatrema bivittatum]
MEWKNGSIVTEFILTGLSNTPELQTLLFHIFALIYTTTLLGNLGLLTMVIVDPHLHTPMYFFLANLSALDTVIASITVPKMLDNFLSDRKSTSFLCCMTQMFCFQLIIVVECFLIAMMGIDRYVAICKPLSYTVIMNRNICIQLIVICWIAGFLNSSIHITLASTLSFCGPNTIDHFFCDIPALLKLSCSDTSTQELILFTVGVILGFIPCLVVLASYYHIVSSILKIATTTGRHRAFSTCASHLTIVTMFYGGGFSTHIITPNLSSSLDVNKAITVLYIILSPMLNPFIYSLRNMEVKKALRRIMGRTCFSKRI